MRDYAQEYNSLNKDINNDILNTFLAIEKKIGSETLVMGFDYVTKQPNVLKNRSVIRISLNTRLKGFYTKCNHIGINKFAIDDTKLFIKGFQVCNHRYKFTPIHYLSIDEKSYILKHLKEHFKDIL